MKCFCVAFLFLFFACKKETPVATYPRTKEFYEAKAKILEIAKKHNLSPQIGDEQLAEAIAKGIPINYDLVDKKMAELDAQIGDRSKICNDSLFKESKAAFSQAKTREAQIAVVKKYPACFDLKDWGLE